MTSAPLTTERVAWFQCAAGVAGDMLLSALVDAGAPTDQIVAAIAGLGVDGYALTFENVQRCGVRSTWMNLVIDHDHDDDHDHGHDHEHDHEHSHTHRPAREVLEIIAAADLAPRVATWATAVYRRLAEVEGQIHGVPWEQVELHEVGALDAIIDVVGVCAALDALDITRVVCSPIAVGHGTVRAAHGLLSNPAPAVTLLLAGAGAPSVGLDTTMELSTPTGVALMTSLATSTGGGFGALPAMHVQATGFGAGTADPPGRPNVVQVLIGSPLQHTSGTAAGVRLGTGETVVHLATNIDDVTGEVIAHTITALLAAGAHDAWATPIVMKKGRPAHTLAALCSEATLAAVSEVMVRETGTLGLRAERMERWPQQREEFTVTLDGQPIRIKRSAGRIKVEHDDAVQAATALGTSLRNVMQRAEALAHDT